MGNVVFIVWRESLEAVLIIGILHSFLAKRSQDATSLRKQTTFLWSGVSAGVLLSALLAYATLKIENQLTGNALEYFQTTILFASAILMTQMVMWMKKNGRKLKSSLETELQQAMTTSGLWGVALVAAFSVAREGTETVVYLYGMSLENAASGFGSLAIAATAGLLLAFGTAYAVSKGIRFLNYGAFFRVTSIVLLLSAAGLLITGASRLIEVDLIPSLVDPLWNSSWLIDGNSKIGGIFAAFTGYRARPSLMLVLIYAGFWTLVWAWGKRLEAKTFVGVRA